MLEREPPVHLVSYDDLVADPAGLAREVAAHFDLDVPEVDPADIEEVAGRYSKDPRMGFDPAGAHLRPALPPSVAGEVAAASALLMGRLEARTGGSAGSRGPDADRGGRR
jgi:hypothetical protein